MMFKHLIFFQSWTECQNLMAFGYRKHYSPGYGEIIYGGKATGLKNLLVIFDSGSSYTYLSSKAYEGLLYMVCLQVLNLLSLQIMYS